MFSQLPVVEDVCVDERLHRQGIGRVLMNFAMEFASERGCWKLVRQAML